MKKRVLEVAFGTLANGGVSSVIMSIIEPLHRDFDFSVLCYDNPTLRRKTQLAENNCKLYVSRPRWLNRYLDFILRPFIYFFSCISLFRRERFDVVHCHDSSEGGVVLLAAKLCGVKKRIMHSHNPNPPVKRKNPAVGIYRWFQRRLFLRYATEFVGCSEQACVDLFGNKPHNVINNSIDIKRFLCPTEHNPDVLNFIHVGRMTFQKNQSMVIDIFSEILKQLPDSKLTMIGEGEDLNLIKGKVSELNICSSVNFLPASANIAEEFKKSSFMIFPSNYEGFGIVLVEAQAANVYCYASDVCPATTDIGMIKYLPLSIGSKEWARTIVSNIKEREKHSVEYDRLKMYDSSFIAEEYLNLYGSI